jgi:hypothetical protein
MQLFRSEEHLDRWLAGRDRGAVLTPDQLWGLGREWYENRLDAGWRRRSPEEAEAVFRSLGLSGEFWRLA